MADFSETDIRAALSQVRDPAGDSDIIASGRVQGLVLPSGLQVRLQLLGLVLLSPARGWLEQGLSWPEP